MRVVRAPGLETLLLVAGVLLLGWSAMGRAVSWAFQHSARAHLEAAIHARAGTAPAAVRFRGVGGAFRSVPSGGGGVDSGF